MTAASIRTGGFSTYESSYQSNTLNLLFIKASTAPIRIVLSKMVVIAIVGGTGGVGRTLVEAFVADGKYQVIVLARKVQLTFNATR